MDEYRVISVSPVGKKKYKITLEGTRTVILSLYPSEVRRYALSEGAILSDKDYTEIQDILYKRGKERALYYLKTSDKTVAQIKSKLREGFYPDDIIDKIIAFLEKYSYLDDYRYAENYISYNRKRKSIQRMRNDLSIKGIDKNILEEAFLEAVCEEDDTEEQLIEEYCRKKVKTDMDEKQYNKVIMALMRKGFKYEQIKSVLRRVIEETTT